MRNADPQSPKVRRGIPFPASNPIYEELEEALDQAKGFRVRLCEIERDIEGIKQAMQTKDALLASKDDTIRQMDKMIRNYEEVVSMKNGLIAQKDDCVKQASTIHRDESNNVANDVKDEMIKELEETVRRKEKSRQELATAMLRKNETIKKLEKQTSDQRSAIKGLERKREQLEVAVERQNKQLEMAIELQDLTNETKQHAPQMSELLLRDQIRHKDEQLSKLVEDLSAARVSIQSLTRSSVQDLDGIKRVDGQSTDVNMLRTTSSTDPIKAEDSFISLVESTSRASNTNGMATRPPDPTWREAAASILQDLAPKKLAGTDKPADAIQSPKKSDTINHSTPSAGKVSAPIAPKMFTFKSTPSSRRSASGQSVASYMGIRSNFGSPLIASSNNQLATAQSALSSTGIFGSTLSTFVCTNCGKMGHRSLLCTSPRAICSSSEHTRMECSRAGSESTPAASSTILATAPTLDEGTAVESAPKKMNCSNCGTMGHFREQCENYEPRAASSSTAAVRDVTNANVEPGSGDLSGDSDGQKKRKVDDEVEITGEAAITLGAKRIKIEEE